MYINMSRMRKSKSQKKGFLKKVKSATSRVLPNVASGLNRVGSDVSNVALKKTPFVKRGVSDVYGVLATGFDMGVKGVKSGVSGVEYGLQKGVNVVSRKRRGGRRGRGRGTRRH
jgi:hypothetical protein